MSDDSVLMVDDVNFIQLRLTDRVCTFFNDNAILFAGPRLHPDHDRFVRFTKHGPVEQYTLFGGYFAFPMGAFSYSHNLVTDFRCGRYCSIGAGLTILGERHPMEWVTTSNITYCFKPNWNRVNFLRAHAELMGGQWAPMEPPGLHTQGPVFSDDVWVALDVTMARGITIGTGAVVGTGSVVTKSVEPYMIVGGNPARVIRRRFPDAVCDQLIASRWWELHPSVLFQMNSRDPVEFLRQIASVHVSPCPVRSFTWQDVLNELA